MQINKHERWREHLAAARDFSGSIDSYCRAKGITASAFYYWKKKLGEIRPRASAPSISRFVPVEVVRGPHSGNGLPNPKWLAEFLLHLSGGAR